MTEDDPLEFPDEADAAAGPVIKARASLVHATEGRAPPDFDGRFNGREDFRALVRTAFATAAAEGWRRLVISDASFEDWPLGERELTQSLMDWSASGREFVMLARRYDTVQRDHARFVQWRRTWSHIIDCRMCPSADALELPSAIWSDAWALRRLDPVRSNGVCGRGPDRRLALREDLDEWLRKSTPGFPATTLGL